MRDFEYDRNRAMKQTDFKPCACCGKGVMHTGLPLFYRVTIERMGVDSQAVQRQHGLEMMLGGQAKIAHVMGENADMGLPIGAARKGLLCEKCASNLDFSFAELTEALNKTESEKDEAGRLMRPTPPTWEADYRHDRRAHRHRCRCCGVCLETDDRALMARVGHFTKGRHTTTWAIHIACADKPFGVPLSQPNIAGWTWRDAFEAWGIEHLRRSGWEKKIQKHPMSNTASVKEFAFASS